MLIFPIVVFSIAGLLGLGVIVLAWPLLVAREHRRRMIAMLSLVTLLVVCTTFGQFLINAFGAWCAHPSCSRAMIYRLRPPGEEPGCRASQPANVEVPVHLD